MIALITKRVLLVALLAFGAVPGHTAQEHQSFQVKSGNDVYEGIGACHSLSTNSEDNQAVRCFVTGGYLDGVIHTLDHLHLIDVPTGVTHGQIEDVVHRYLDIHPETRQESAVALIFSAAQQAWPDQSSKKKKN